MGGLRREILRKRRAVGERRRQSAKVGERPSGTGRNLGRRDTKGGYRWALRSCRSTPVPARKQPIDSSTGGPSDLLALQLKDSPSESRSSSSAVGSAGETQFVCKRDGACQTCRDWSDQVHPTCMFPTTDWSEEDARLTWHRLAHSSTRSEQVILRLYLCTPQSARSLLSPVRSGCIRVQAVSLNHAAITCATTCYAHPSEKKGN